MKTTSQNASKPAAEPGKTLSPYVNQRMRRKDHAALVRLTKRVSKLYGETTGMDVMATLIKHGATLYEDLQHRGPMLKGDAGLVSKMTDAEMKELADAYAGAEVIGVIETDSAVEVKPRKARPMTPKEAHAGAMLDGLYAGGGKTKKTKN